MKVSGTEGAAEVRVDRVLDDEQRPRDARHGPPHRGRDEVEPLRARAHQGDGLAILADRADGRAGERARQEQVEPDHGEDRQHERDQPGEGDEDPRDLDRGQRHRGPSGGRCSRAASRTTG